MYCSSIAINEHVKQTLLSHYNEFDIQPTVTIFEMPEMILKCKNPPGSTGLNNLVCRDKREWQYEKEGSSPDYIMSTSYYICLQL
jgi:hypothetical protein